MQEKGSAPFQWAVIAFMALVVVAVLTARMISRRPVAPGVDAAPVIVEVQGDVENPGVRLLTSPEATVRQAVHGARVRCGAAQVRASPELMEHRLHTGDLVRVSCRPPDAVAVRVDRMDAASRLTLGLKLDVNTATEDELQLIPAMRSAFAAAIVRRRQEHPWRSLDELREIRGVGPKTVGKWRAYLTVAPASDKNGGRK